MRWWVLTKFIVVIISQYTYISNNHIVHLKFIQDYMSLLNKTGKNLYMILIIIQGWELLYSKHIEWEKG